MINAVKDDDVPVSFSKSFYDEYLNKHLEDSSSLDLFVADEFHFVSPEMIERAIEWIKTNL